MSSLVSSHSILYEIIESKIIRVHSASVVVKILKTTYYLMDKSLNLGKYSIRENESSSNFKVGSFWKRQQSHDTDDTQIVSESSVSKKLAIETSYSSRPSAQLKISTNSRSISIDSDAFTDSQRNCATSDDTTSFDQSSIETSRINALESRLNKANVSHINSAPSYEEPSNSSRTRNSGLVIDTQATINVNKDDNEDTHESVVVSLDPLAFEARVNSHEEESHPNIDIPIGDPVSYTPNAPKRMRKKVYPKSMPYDKIMSHVTFVMSGYENPRRGKLRDMALEMGAKYQPNWNRFCTHLICAFKNTPKYKEVMAENGRIVREHWIQECSRMRQLIDWRDYKLGKYPYPDSEEEVINDDDDLDYVLETSYSLKRLQTKR